MAFWNKKQKEIELPPIKIDEFTSIAESLAQGGLPRAIESQIQKTINSSLYYQAFDDEGDQGGYFGSEFNIRATAGRIKSTYTREPWVFATATLLAKSLSSIPYICVDAVTNEPMPNHPLQAKLNLSNRLQDNKTIEWSGVIDLVLGGNFFRVFNETYTEMMQVPVESVSIKLSKDKKEIESILVWDSELGAVSNSIPYKQVIQHKFPNPFSPYYGLSLFVACSRPILMDRFKNEFEMAFYLRGATNSGVVECTEDISKERMKRLMKTFEQVYTGKRNWWRTIFLPKGTTWKSSGLTMTEMQHLEGLRENRLTILAALGIPPSALGIVQDVNRSTSDAQDKYFWQNTVKPLAEFIASGWNNSFLVKTIYGGRVNVIPDFSGISVLQGSLKEKGDEAKAVESYLIINEIRKDILGYEPLADERGNKFVSEIKPAQAPGVLGAMLNVPDVVEQKQVETLPASNVKAQVTGGQDRIEKRIAKEYSKGYLSYIDNILKLSEYALRNGKDLEKFLDQSEKKLAEKYWDDVKQPLNLAMERGFSLANSQVKEFRSKTKDFKFRETDQQAVDALREKTRRGERAQLEKRSISRFEGFNKTRTNEIMDIVAQGLKDGETLERVAGTLREKYTETYKDQMFTVARTETLTAVSQGLKWNHDVLGKIFSEVKKQWFHVGDVGSNPDARDWHADYETLGAVDSDYKFGGVLEYPRDPSGSASDTINCRCSLVTVIPDGATSNAEIILEDL
jgi:HK97 family phage portal protein